MLNHKTLSNINKIISGNISEDDSTIMRETLIILIEIYKEKLAFPCLVCEDKLYKPNNLAKVFDNYFHYAIIMISGGHNNKILSFEKMSFLVETKGHWTAVQLYIIQGKFYFFVLDAASTSKVHSVLRIIEKSFEKNNLLGKIFFSSPIIQRDGINCSLFSLHHIFKLTKFTNFIDYLKLKEGTFKQNISFQRTTLEPFKILDVTVYDLHPKLLKGIQEFETLYKYNLKQTMFNDQYAFEKLKKNLLEGLESISNIKEFDMSITTYQGISLRNHFFDKKREKYTEMLKAKKLEETENTLSLYIKYVSNHKNNFFKLIRTEKININANSYHYYT